MDTLPESRQQRRIYAFSRARIERKPLQSRVSGKRWRDAYDRINHRVRHSKTKYSTRRQAGQHPRVAGYVLQRKEINALQAVAGFLRERRLVTKLFVVFSKSIPHALKTTAVITKIKMNIATGCGRILSPSQMTYGW